MVFILYFCSLIIHLSPDFYFITLIRSRTKNQAKTSLNYPLIGFACESVLLFIDILQIKICQ